jgi:hypothetical protein
MPHHEAADEIEQLRAVLDSRLRVALDNRQALDDLVAAESKVRSLQAEIERLRAVLRMVRSDRPTAHSEAVWQAINEALAEQERSHPQENDR